VGRLIFRHPRLNLADFKGIISAMVRKIFPLLAEGKNGQDKRGNRALQEAGIVLALCCPSSKDESI